jgi:protein-tyrosine phosphatase
VTSDVWIGSQLNGEAARQAIRAGVTAVLDLTAEFSKAEPFREITYRNIQVLDLTAPTSPQLDAMTEFITANVPNGIVYVHCKIGYSRSAAAVAAYLLATGTASDAEQAVSMIRRARPSIVVRPEIVNALRLFDGARARADSRTFVLASTASALA